MSLINGHLAEEEDGWMEKLGVDKSIMLRGSSMCSERRVHFNACFQATSLRRVVLSIQKREVYFPVQTRFFSSMNCILHDQKGGGREAEEKKDNKKKKVFWGNLDRGR